MNWKHKYSSPYVVPMVISFVPLMSFHVWKGATQVQPTLELAAVVGVGVEGPRDCAPDLSYDWKAVTWR